ncbi:MAG TPA: ROK family transcriptional regulator [Actinomycetales bacterium]|nr:ROK family transcriptional regulator [Actinomycetales bacterium]
MSVRNNPSSTLTASGTRRAGDLLQLLLDGEPCTRADLVETTGQSRTTVRFKLDQLVAAGLVQRVGEAPSTGGRPAIRFAFNPDARVVLAIDIGNTHARLAVCNLGGEIITDHLMEVHAENGPEELLDEVLAQSHTLLDSTGRASELAGVGVGVPVGVDRSTGHVIDASALPKWFGYDLRARISSAFDRPVAIDNDVNLMARGEISALPAEVEHLVFLKLASSLSSGIIVGRRVVHGVRGMAGNISHVRVADSDAECACGKRGCLEVVASGAALVAQMAQIDPAITSEIDLVTLVRQGDEQANAIISRAGTRLGEALATFVDLLNPAVVVIGGVLALAGEPLLSEIRAQVEAHAHYSATAELEIITAQAEQKAGVLGASSLIIDHVLAPESVDQYVNEITQDALTG